MNTFKELKKIIKEVIKENPIENKKASSTIRGLFMDINDMVKEGKITKEQRDELVGLLKSK